jgi:hypothetical protein
VINPAILPTTADCAVAFAATVVDKDGLGVTSDPAAPGSPSFHTEPMTLVVSSPADGQTGVPIASPIAITFNVELLAALDETSLEVIEMVSGTAVPGTAALDPADPATLVFTPTADLAINTVYQVTALTGAQGVRDSFNSPLPQDETFTFTTGAM